MKQLANSGAVCWCVLTRLLPIVSKIQSHVTSVRTMSHLGDICSVTLPICVTESWISKQQNLSEKLRHFVDLIQVSGSSLGAKDHKDNKRSKHVI